MSTYQVIGPCKIGQDTILGFNVIIGHPAKKSLNAYRDFSKSNGSIIGDRCIIRSGTVVYEDVSIGNDFQTGHNVVIREGVCIKDGGVIGSNSDIFNGAQFGRNVRLSTHVAIAENAVLGNDIFIGPGVAITGGRYMTGAAQASGKMSEAEAFAMEGKNWQGPSVVVEDDVRIGANSTILAGVRLGKGCVIAAGSVVSNDVPECCYVAGNPARVFFKKNINLDKKNET